MAEGPGEKLTSELPRVRVTEEMETALMRAAARRDRSLSDFIRYALADWLWGHERHGSDPSES